jgi:hypothetical protein
MNNTQAQLILSIAFASGVLSTGLGVVRAAGPAVAPKPPSTSCEPAPEHNGMELRRPGVVCLGKRPLIRRQAVNMLAQQSWQAAIGGGVSVTLVGRRHCVSPYRMDCNDTTALDRAGKH